MSSGKKIDQWGADGLSLLRNKSPSSAHHLNRERLAIFVISFLFRNPRKISEFEARAREHVRTSCLKDDYLTHRHPHEPATFEEFLNRMNQPGLTEVGAKLLRHAVCHAAIRAHILTMDWQVVTVTNGASILTSDVPLITYKGLKEDDGLLILPLSSDEFFVAFNRGRHDMVRWINASIEHGKFIEEMNKHVIQNRIEFVYGADRSQLSLVATHWKNPEPVANR